jgi:hypothetical protein
MSCNGLDNIIIGTTKERRGEERREEGRVGEKSNIC